MGAKWTIIALLGLMAGVRLFQPQFFLAWTTGKLDREDPIAIPSLVLMWVVLATCSYFLFSTLNLDYSTGVLFAVLPIIVLARILFSNLIVRILRQENMRLPSLEFFQIAPLALLYLITTSLVLIVHWTWPAAQPWIFRITLSAHILGLVLFSIKHEGFVHFSTLGVRIYAVLYLCALELTPLFLALG